VEAWTLSQQFAYGIGFDVTVPWSACLFVCLSVMFVHCAVRQNISNRHGFFCIRQPQNLIFGLHRSTPSSPNFAPKSPTSPCWFELRRHSMASCGRMVRDSAITVKRL